MTDLFKDIVKAWEERVRSPFLGSIGVAFVACNWKPIFFLLFSGEPVLDRFAFVDANTNLTSLLFKPVLLGVLLAIGIPWLKFIGAWVAKAPTARLNDLQGDLASERRIHELAKAAEEQQAKANLEAAQEQRRIDAAKRLEDAKEIGDDEFVEEFQQERETRTELLQGKDAFQEVEAFLTPELKALIVAIGKVESGGISERDLNFDRGLISNLTDLIPNISKARIGVEIETGVQQLGAMRIAQHDRSGNWMLTKMGYHIFDRLLSAH